MSTNSKDTLADRYTIDRYACPKVEGFKPEPAKEPENKDKAVQIQLDSLNERLDSIEFCLNTMINNTEPSLWSRTVAYWFNDLDRRQAVALWLIPLFILGMVGSLIILFARGGIVVFVLWILGLITTFSILGYWVYILLIHKKKTYTKIEETV